MEQNKKNTAKIVAMKMAERMNQPAKEDGKRKGVLIIIDQKPPVADNTTLMLYAVKLRAVDERNPTAYLSLGTPNVDIVNQLIAITTGIDHEKIVNGNLTDDEWALVDERLPMLMDAPLYVDDSSGVTMLSLKEKLTMLAGKGVTLAVIDHADVDPDAKDGTDFLKSIAEELRMTIIFVTE